MSATLRARVRVPGLVVAVAAANLVLVLALEQGGLLKPMMVALLPLALILVGILFSSHRELLVFAGLTLPMTFDALGDKKIALGGGLSLFSADIIVLLAFVPWLASRMVGRRDLAPPVLRTPVLGLPLVLFAAALLQATLRGHFNFGQSLISQPIRMIVYSLIATALVGLDVRRAYRGIVAVFYVGMVYVFFYSLYLIAAGRSLTGQTEISTGGSRVLSGTISQASASAFILALLSLRLDTSARRRMLHLVMALVAGANIALSFQRTTEFALAVILPLLFVTVRRIAGSFAMMIPLALPFLAVVAIFLPSVAPQLAPQFITRITETNGDDRSLQQRERLSSLQWDQARTSPLTGVGFGQTLQVHVPFVTSTGYTNYRREEAGQEGHNSYFWLLAAGGFTLLGSFLLIIGTYAVDTCRRLMSARDEHERVLLMWCGISLFVLLVNAATSPALGKERTLLAIWTLLLLPSIVPHRPRLRRGRPGTP